MADTRVSGIIKETYQLYSGHENPLIHTNTLFDTDIHTHTHTHNHIYTLMKNLKAHWLAAAVEEFGVRYGVHAEGAGDVGAQALGRLVGHLHPALEHGHGEVGRRVAGQPQAEVRVGGIRVQLLKRRGRKVLNSHLARRGNHHSQAINALLCLTAELLARGFWSSSFTQHPSVHTVAPERKSSSLFAWPSFIYMTEHRQTHITPHIFRNTHTTLHTYTHTQTTTTHPC